MPCLIFGDSAAVDGGFERPLDFKPEAFNLLLRRYRVEHAAPHEKALNRHQRNARCLAPTPARTNDFTLRRRGDETLLFGMGDT